MHSFSFCVGGGRADLEKGRNGQTPNVTTGLKKGGDHCYTYSRIHAVKIKKKLQYLKIHLNKLIKRNSSSMTHI